MKNIRAFLAQLSRELQQELHRDVEQLEESDSTQIQSVLDRVKALESRFAATHPVLERTARELADAIAKMGI